MSAPQDTDPAGESLPARDPAEIEQLRDLLKAHRATMAHYLKQRAIFSEAYAPPSVLHGIGEAREQIGRIKAALREHGAPVEDFLIDNGFADPAEAFGDDYERFRADYIIPWEIFERVELEHFIGRAWLLAEVDTFLRQHDRGYFVLEAEAGLGKTTFLAWLVQQRAYMHHFSELAPGLRGVERSINNLVAQLVLTYQQRLSEAVPVSSDAASLSNDLASLLKQISDRLEPGEQVVLVVDALDEAGSPEGLNVLGLPKTLPPGIFFIVSQRPAEVRLQVTARTARYRCRLNADSAENRADTQRFLDQALQWEGVAEALRLSTVAPAAFTDTLLDKCRGVWVYLYHVLKDIDRARVLPADLSTLPEGLTHYYIQYWGAWHGRDRRAWHEVYLPLLATLAAAREPVPLRKLHSWAGVALTDWELGDLLMRHWRPFLTVSGEGERRSYQFYHATLREFFYGKIDTRGQELFSNEQAFVEELKRAAESARERIIATLIAEMRDAPAEAARRDAAFQLIRMDWRADGRRIDAQDLLRQLELVIRYSDTQSQRDYLIDSIDTLRARQDTRQKARLAVCRAALQGQSNRLPEAKHDYARAREFVGELVGPAEPLVEDLLLAARIDLGLGTIAVIEAQQLDPADPTRKTALEHAVARYTSAARAAERYGLDPVLIVTVYRQLIYTHALLEEWGLAKEAYRLAATILDASEYADHDPSVLATCRAQMMEAVNQMHLMSSQALRQRAIAELASAYDLVKQEIDMLERAYATSGDVILIDDLALAHINAGEYLREMSQYHECAAYDPIATACNYWQIALEKASSAGITERQKQASDLIALHCGGAS
jgi:hypothetical protein